MALAAELFIEVQTLSRERRFQAVCERLTTADLQEQYESSPLLRAVARTALGRIAFELALYRLARPLLRGAVEDLRLVPDPAPVEGLEKQWVAFLAAAADLRLGRDTWRKELAGDSLFVATKVFGVGSSLSLEDIRARATEHPNLMSGSCRAHRAALQRTPRSDRLLLDVEGELQRLRRASQDDTASFDTALGMVPIATEIAYHCAAHAFDQREFQTALDTLETVQRLPFGNWHLAADLLLVRVRRGLGHTRAARMDTISKALSRVEILARTDLSNSVTVVCGAVPDGHGDEALAALARPEEVLAKHRAALLRDRALIESNGNYVQALGSCQQAQSIVGANPSKNYSDIRYHALSGAKDDLLSASRDVLDQLFENTAGAEQWERIAPAFDPTEVDQPPTHGQLFGLFDTVRADRNLDIERALLAAGDALRASGRNRLAKTWYSALSCRVQRSGYVASRYVSMLLSTGEPNLAIDIALARRRAPRMTLRDLLELQLGRAFLAIGKLEDAETQFKGLCGLVSMGPSPSPWVPTETEAWCGLIDVARHRRDLTAANDAADQALAKRGVALDVGLTAQIRIARAWAEVQVGEPRRAIPTFVAELPHNPFDIGAWIGLVRALRLLGRPSDAEQLLHALLGEPGTGLLRLDFKVSGTSVRRSTPGVQAPDWIEAGGVPNLSLIHGSTIRSELGWCLLDQDRPDDARECFTSVLTRSPYNGAAQRGLLAASMNDGALLISQRIELVLGRASSVLQPGSVDATAETRAKDHHMACRGLHLEALRIWLRTGQSDKAFDQRALLDATIWADDVSDSTKLRYLYAIADTYLDEHELVDAKEILRTLIAMLRLNINLEAIDLNGLPDLGQRTTVILAKYLLAARLPQKAIALLQRYRDVATVATSCYAIDVAYLVALFEARRFEDASMVAEECNELYRHRSGLIELIQGWAALASSELPHLPPSDVQRCIDIARKQSSNLDGTLVDKLHLDAIIHARQAEADQAHLDTRQPTKKGQRWRRRDEEEEIEKEEHRNDPTPALQSLAYLDRALAHRPQDAGLLRDKAAILLHTGQDTAAGAILRTGGTSVPRDARAHLLAGLYYSRVGDQAAAIENFQAAAAADPMDYVHHRALAAALLRAGKAPEAIAALDKATGVVRPIDRANQLRTLKARAEAAAADKLDPKTRRIRLLAAERALNASNPRRGPEYDEHVAMRAFLLAQSGRVFQARRVLSRTPTDSKLKYWQEVNDQITEAAQGSSILERSAPWLALCYAITGIATVAALAVLTFRDSADGQADFPIGGIELFGGLVLFTAVFVFALVFPNIRSIQVRDLQVQLEQKQVLDEVVHVDLDLSAGRILRASGFSYMRPGIPFDVIEPRVTPD